MTDEELTRLETLAAAATPGAWTFVLWDPRTGLGPSVYAGDRCVVSRGGADDLRAIVAAHEAVPALVAEVRRLRTALGYSEQRVTLLRAELVAALDEGRQALDAADARCDAAERAAETARAEGREACVRVLRDRAEALRAEATATMPRERGPGEASALHRAAMLRNEALTWDECAAEIRARGGDRG